LYDSTLRAAASGNAVSTASFLESILLSEQSSAAAVEEALERSAASEQQAVSQETATIQLLLIASVLDTRTAAAA